MGRRFDPDRAHFLPFNSKLVDYYPPMNQELITKRISWILLITGPAVSLAVSPSPSFDPINLIKLLILASAAFMIFGLFISSTSKLIARVSKYFWFFCGLFVLSMTSSFFFSGAPKGQQFWGSFGRNTGLLTYLSLLFILIGTAIVQKIVFYRSIINSLVLTSIPVLIYCLIQIAGLDPVGWSSKDTFATFGNTNFLSAFLGMSALASIVLAFDKNQSLIRKIGLVSITILSALIILDTGSIQGFMILVAGLGIAGYLFIRSGSKLSKLRIPYSILAFLGLIITVLGVTNKGPLASFIFQPSILYRADYMHAGWVMTAQHPFFGVGLDSYGDWYREVRGLISTTRTGPERTANTAHNIFLDLSSNGGLPLILSYIALLVFALVIGFRWIRKNKHFDPYFAAIFSCWVAYQIQALVSINQMAVGIWGWMLNGALIGYGLSAPLANNVENVRKAKNKKSSTLPASSGALALIFGVIGFALAYIPFNADAKYKAANLTGNLTNIIKAVELPGTSGWHISQALNVAIVNNFSDQAKTLDNLLLTKYPRDIYGWKMLYYMTSSTPAEKQAAFAKLIEMDPYNPENPKS